MRAVVSYASGRYMIGQRRLRDALGEQCKFIGWTNQLPLYSPPHEQVPFAFKAWAMKAAHEVHGATTLLWCDSCIVPIRPLGPLFDEIEAKGYVIFNNGWINSDWTAEHAYSDLQITREQNDGIKHVVAGFFGLDMNSEIGRQIFDEYMRLAQTRAFIGPTWNSNHPQYAMRAGAAPCGNESVRGHRHDQTALSVAAWKAGAVLTDCPKWFSYKGGETEATVAIADGGY